jgi:hypothetical protein
MVHEGIIPKAVIGSAKWEWEDQSQGLVKWTFTNTGSAVGSFVLSRGAVANNISAEPPYVFGTAFNAIYLNNPEDFDTHLITEVTPLQDNGVAANSPPMALITDGSGNMMIAFIFTLSSGQSWSMLEGGFTNGFEPSDPKLIPVKYEKIGTFCWAWNNIQCEGFNEQSGSNLPCPANPLQITTAVFICQEPLNPAFVDKFTDGPCTSTSGSSGAKTCILEILKGLESGDSTDILSGIECLLGSLKLTDKLVQDLIWQKIKKI